MKGTKWAFAMLAVLLAAKAFGLLPQGREPEERKLVSALAVDGWEEVTVTAVTGVRISEEEEAEVLKGTGEDLTSACRDLRSRSTRQAYLGQTEQLLIGEGRDLEETLDFMLAHRELRLDTLLYIVRGNGGEALAASADRVAEETGGRDPRGRTAGETLARLAEGEYTLAPALAPGEEGALEPAGWAVLGPEGVAGYLEEEAALGAALLMGLGGEEAVTLPHGAATLTEVRIWAWDGVLHCGLTARVAEGEPKEADLAAWGEKILTAALAAGWDCWGLDRELGALSPGGWERWRDWPVEELKVEATGKLVRD